MIFLIYALLALVIFITTTLYVLREDAQKYRPSRDNGDFFMMGSFTALLAIIWPFTIFGIISVLAGNYYKNKADREREITRELSRG